MANVGPWLIAACIKRAFDELDAHAPQGASKDLLGTAFAISAFFYGKHIGDLTDDQILRAIKLARLKIKVDASREVSVAAIKNEIMGVFKASQFADSSIRPDSSAKPIVVEKQQGSTVYHIQNLNVYLTAEVVQQLNMNPGHVINMVQENLEKQIGVMSEKGLKK